MVKSGVTSPHSVTSGPGVVAKMVERTPACGRSIPCRRQNALDHAPPGTDEAKRKGLYGEMQALIAEQDSLSIPLFNSFYDSHTIRLKGLSPIPTGGVMGFGFAENVWLEG